MKTVIIIIFYLDDANPNLITDRNQSSVESFQVESCHVNTEPERTYSESAQYAVIMHCNGRCRRVDRRDSRRVTVRH